MTHPTYTAHAHREPDWWVIEIPDAGPVGIVTQTRRIEQAEAMARDAIAVYLETPPDSFDVEVHVELDQAISSELQQLREAQAAAEKTQQEAAGRARDLVAKLRDMGLSTRDIGRVLGVSHQRAAQLASR